MPYVKCNTIRLTIRSVKCFRKHMDEQYTSDLPPEIEDEETLAEPLSPSELLNKALNLMPGRDLLPYLTTIIYLRKTKGYSWRGISSWLKENGNIETSHTTVCNFFDYVNNHPNYSHELKEAYEELDITLLDRHENPEEYE